MIDPGDIGRDLVAEVRISFPLDGPFGDSLDDSTRMRDPHLLGPVISSRSSDATGVHQIDIHRVLVKKLEEAVSLLGVKKGEKGIGAGDPEGLARLILAAGAGALGLPQHEIGGRDLGRELCHRGNDVFVSIEDEKKVRISITIDGSVLRDVDKLLSKVRKEQLDKGETALWSRSHIIEKLVQESLGRVSL